MMESGVASTLGRRLWLQDCSRKHVRPLLRRQVRTWPSRHRRVACAGQSNDDNGAGKLNLPGQLPWLKRDTRKAQSTDLTGRNLLTSQEEKAVNSGWFKEAWGRFTYQYFNWRKDAWADVKLLLLLNGVVLFSGGLAKRILVDGEAPGQSAGYWSDIYDVLVLWFGQFPDGSESIASQLFAVAMATVGLGAFAIVLALVEQIVLEILTENVSRGSEVYEKGHVLVLAWAVTQRDREVIWKILSQLCLAYRNDRGRVIVVLSQVPKTEMEETFRFVIPEAERYNSTFVFRQGNPLLPNDLRMVAAPKAAATVLVPDTSRGPEEADAQSLRAAVLLDELDYPGAGNPDPRTGHIVVGLQTQEAVGLIQYSCSARVIPVPTTYLNARRISRNIQYPVLTYVSNNLLNFRSRAQGYLMYCPAAIGMRFGELFRLFPDAIVLGVGDRATGKAVLNPRADRHISPDDTLVMMRPTSIKETDYKPLRRLLPASVGAWDPSVYVMRSRDEQPVRVSGSASLDEGSCASAITGQPLVVKGLRKAKNVSPQAAGCYMLPLEYSATSEEPVNVLVAGWGDQNFMIALLHSMDQELPKDSRVTLLNMRPKEQVLGLAREAAALTKLSLLHVWGDPLKYRDLEAKVSVEHFNTAIVLCDGAWVDPDQNSANGIALRTRDDMLRLDSMIMTVQLGIRKLLEERGFPDINIITEKVAFQGITRFEDRGRLPLGSNFNVTSFSARILSQAAYNPKAVVAYGEFGRETEMLVQDSSCLAGEGEAVSFLTLQARAMAVGQVLVGFFDIPRSIEQPLQLVINPEGVETRTREVVWNRSDNRVKLICLCTKASPTKADMPPSPTTGATGIFPPPEPVNGAAFESYADSVKSAL